MNKELWYIPQTTEINKNEGGTKVPLEQFEGRKKLQLQKQQMRKKQIQDSKQRLRKELQNFQPQPQKKKKKQEISAQQSIKLLQKDYTPEKLEEMYLKIYPDGIRKKRDISYIPPPRGETTSGKQFTKKQVTKQQMQSRQNSLKILEQQYSNNPKKLQRMVSEIEQIQPFSFIQNKKKELNLNYRRDAEKTDSESINQRHKQMQNLKKSRSQNL